MAQRVGAPFALRRDPTTGGRRSRASDVIRDRASQRGGGKVAVSPPVRGAGNIHRDRSDDDSAKRMALSRAGYLVWSLTWHDLEGVFGGAADAFDLLAGKPGAHPMDAVQQALDRRWNTGGLRSRLGESSLALLVAWLADPDPLRWKRAVFTALFRQFDRERMLEPELRQAFTGSAEQASPGFVRDRLAELPEQTCVGGRGRWTSESAGPVDLYLALPLAAVEGGEPDLATAILHLHDDEESRKGKDYRRYWNGVLRAFNLLQFLPGAFWTTRVGIERQRYPELGPKLDPPSEPQVTDAAWREAVDLASPEFRPLLRTLSARGVPVPTVGFELAGEHGTVVAEAEAGWPDAKVAVLLPDQEPGMAAFTAAGWKVFAATDGAEAAIVAALAEEP
jgi:DEAD/DEAH box helicase domain-containing protein